MKHTCHAHGCERVVPPARFVCRAHWARLRPQLQRAIYREYRPGQEIDKKPSLRYLAVQQLAVMELAFKPHDEAAAAVCVPYLANAMRFRDAAIEKGLGDPLEGLIPKEVSDGVAD